jgi:hypothetical protein
MGRKANSSLKSWVKFVKQVQKEEGGSYKEAMMSAKKRKDGGEKWMSGGNDANSTVISGAKVATTGSSGPASQQTGSANIFAQGAAAVGSALSGNSTGMAGPTPTTPTKMGGGKKHKKTAKKQKGGRRKTCKK